MISFDHNLLRFRKLTFSEWIAINKNKETFIPQGCAQFAQKKVSHINSWFELIVILESSSCASLLLAILLNLR